MEERGEEIFRTSNKLGIQKKWDRLIKNIWEAGKELRLVKKIKKGGKEERDEDVTE